MYLNPGVSVDCERKRPLFPPLLFSPLRHALIVYVSYMSDGMIVWSP